MILSIKRITKALARLRRLVCTFVVRKPPQDTFSRAKAHIIAYLSCKIHVCSNLQMYFFMALFPLCMLIMCKFIVMSVSEAGNYIMHYSQFFQRIFFVPFPPIRTCCLLLFLYLFSLFCLFLSCTCKTRVCSIIQMYLVFIVLFLVS